MVCLMRRKSDRSQLMAPATGGWFLDIGGLSACALNSEYMASTCESDVQEHLAKRHTFHQR